MADLELKELNQFYGSEKYHHYWGKILTDGVAYIADNGYSWFVSDIIAVINVKLARHGFLSIKLNVIDDEAKMVITDGNGKELHSQKYKYTNAKRNLNLFYTDGVMMLDTEA